MTGQPGPATHQTPDTGTSPGNPAHLGQICVADKPLDHYLQAVGDTLPIYRQTALAPPLYAAAAALGLLLKTLNLPPGAIHSLQEIDTLAPIPICEKLQAGATVDRPRQRAGLQFITASFTLSAPSGHPTLTGKTTVIAPPQPRPTDAPTTPAPRQTPAPPQPDPPPGDLPRISRQITPERLQAYAAASGDHNPLHLDPAFAATTQFGGIIAHGMLTLALISEMMTTSLGQTWLTRGALRARFKGAAYLGDHIETWGRPTTPDANGDAFVVGVRNQATGEDLITATAALKPH